MKLMKQSMFVSCLLIGVAFAQSQAGVQNSTSASNNTSASVGKHGAQANTESSASSNSTLNATRENREGGVMASGNESTSANERSSTGIGPMGMPAGTPLPAHLDKDLDAKKNKPGDVVTAKTTSDVKQDGKVIIPKGSKLVGHVTDSHARAKGEAQSALGFEFDSLEMKDGRKVPIHGTLQAISAPAVNAATANDDFMGNSMAGGSAMGGGVVSAPARSSGGGLIGGGGGGLLSGGGSVASSTTNSLGSTVSGTTSSASGALSTTTNTTSNLGSSAGGTLSTATNATGNVSGNLKGASSNVAGSTTTGARGVFNLQGVQMMTSGQGSATNSLLVSSDKNIHLESGSQMLVNMGSTVATPK